MHLLHKSSQTSLSSTRHQCQSVNRHLVLSPRKKLAARPPSIHSLLKPAINSHCQPTTNYSCYMCMYLFRHLILHLKKCCQRGPDHSAAMSESVEFYMVFILHKKDCRWLQFFCSSVSIILWNFRDKNICRSSTDTRFSNKNLRNAPLWILTVWPTFLSLVATVGKTGLLIMGW